MFMLHHALALVRQQLMDVACSRQCCKAALLQHAVLTRPATICLVVLPVEDLETIES